MGAYYPDFTVILPPLTTFYAVSDFLLRIIIVSVHKCLLFCSLVFGLLDMTLTLPELC